MMFRRSITKDRARDVLISSVLIAFALSFLASVMPLLAQSPQLSLADILIALRSKKAEIDEKNRILAEAVKNRGITFSLTPEIEKELDNTGAKTELIAAIRSKAVPAPSLEIKESAPAKVVAPEPKATPTPQDFAFFRNRAAGYLKNGDLDLAVADYGKALEFKPMDPRTFLERGQAFARKGKDDLAGIDYSKAIELDPKLAEAYYSRAEMFERMHKPEMALADYTKSLELDPSNELAKLSAERLKKSLDETAAKSVKPAEKPAPKPTEIRGPLSLGPLNAYAEVLAKPEYTAVNRRMNIFGRVKVEIQLDATGKVLEAKAVDGPGSLRRASEEAVRQSKFNPVVVDGVGVAATGYIIFNFVNQ